MRPVKDFYVMAREPDGQTHEVTVTASCFESAVAQAISTLPAGSVVTFAQVEA